MSKLIKKGDVWVINYGDYRSFPIGRIKQDTLYLDSPSRHKQSKSYGIDIAVLQTHAMDYKYIDVLVGKDHWITSRLYWYHHGKKYSLLNGRDELFLRDALFGADKAIKYEEYQKYLETCQQDIFDVLKEDNPKKTEKFMLGLQAETEYQESIKERKIEL